MLSAVAGVPLQRRSLSEPGQAERLFNVLEVLAPAYLAAAGLPVHSAKKISQISQRFDKELIVLAASVVKRQVRHRVGAIKSRIQLA